jgi:transcriptional regulator with XRE-family HTH domain
MGKWIDIGEALRRARLMLGAERGRVVTLDEVADAVGMSRPALNKLELGKAEPTYQTIRRLCDFYGKSPNELLGYSENGDDGGT